MPAASPSKLSGTGSSLTGRALILVVALAFLLLALSVPVRNWLAQRAEAPDHIAQEKPASGASRANLRAYLGTIPDYTESDLKGVLVNGVAKGSPAEDGGMQGGDVIVEVAGKAIENIYDYTYALNALKVGQPALIRVLRAGQRVELTITPASRE